VPAEEKAAYTLVVALRTQEASVAVVETPVEVRIQAGGNPGDPHNQPETVEAVVVNLKAEVGGAHSVAVVAEELSCNLQLDDRQIQEAERPVADRPFEVGRRVLLEGRRGRCR